MRLSKVFTLLLIVLLAGRAFGGEPEPPPNPQRQQPSQKSGYPIPHQPGIYGDAGQELANVVRPTPPVNAPLATCWFFALNNVEDSRPAAVLVDYLQVRAVVDGQDVLVSMNDYGNGPGKMRAATGALTMRYNPANGTTLVDEKPPQLFADGVERDWIILRPHLNRGYAEQIWIDKPKPVPRGATNVYVVARILVQGSAVCSVGLDWWNAAGTVNINGSYSGFNYYDLPGSEPKWQTITFGK
jgi:hypothetical protein